MDQAQRYAEFQANDFPYLTLSFHCPVTCWACYSGTCGHAADPSIGEPE